MGSFLGTKRGEKGLGKGRRKDSVEDAEREGDATRSERGNRDRKRGIEKRFLGFNVTQDLVDAVEHQSVNVL